MSALRFVPLAALFILAACQSVPPVPPAEPLDISGTPYQLKVASIQVSKDYVSPHGPANVEYLADVPPAQAMKQWIAHRLVAAGQEGSLEITIKDASIVKKDLPKQKTGVEGFFTKEQTEEFDGTLIVEMKLYSGHRVLPAAHIEASAYEAQTIREDADIPQRKAVYQRITAELIKQVNTQLDNNIRQYFANYVIW